MLKDPFLPVKRNWLKTTKLVGLVATGVFLILILIVFYLNKESQNDLLINYAPSQTIAYVNFKVPAWSSKKDFFSSLPASAWPEVINEKLGTQVDWLQDVLPKTQQLSLVFLPKEENAWQLVLLIKTNNSDLKTRLSGLQNSQTLSKNIIAVASSPEALQSLNKEGGNSLAGKISPQQFYSWPLIIYIDSLALNNQLGDNTITEMFSHSVSGDLFIKAKQQDGVWQLKISSLMKNSISARSILQSLFLPNDFLVYVHGINLGDLLSSLVGVNSRLDIFSNQAVAQDAAVYNFNWEKIKYLFNQPLDLVVLGQQSNFIGFDFILSGNGAKIDWPSFEQLISIVLSQKYPDEEPKVLPDKTIITQLVANPNRFAWQTQTFNDMFIKTIDQPDDRFSLAYYLAGQQFYLSSSSTLMVNFLNQKDLSLVELIKHCGLDLNNQYWFLNNIDNKFWEYLPAGLIGLQPSDSQGLDGCVVNLR